MLTHWDSYTWGTREQQVVGDCRGLAPRKAESFLFRRDSTLEHVRHNLSRLFGRGKCGGIVAPAIRFFSMFGHRDTKALPRGLCDVASTCNELLILEPSSALPVTHVTTAELGNTRLPVELCCGRGIFSHHGGLANEGSRASRDNVRLVKIGNVETSVRIVRATVRTLGIYNTPSCGVRVNRTNFFGTLYSRLSTPRRMGGSVGRCVRRGGFITLGSILSALNNSEITRAVHGLPQVFNKDRIVRGTVALYGDSGTRDSLGCLSGLCGGLNNTDNKSGLVVSLDLIRQDGCCANVIFHKCARNDKTAILRNNECSNLVGRFNRSLPTVNFNIRASSLTETTLVHNRVRPRGTSRILIFNRSNCRLTTMGLIERLSRGNIGDRGDLYRDHSRTLGCTGRHNVGGLFMVSHSNMSRRRL